MQEQRKGDVAHTGMHGSLIDPKKKNKNSQRAPGCVIDISMKFHRACRK